MRKARFTPEEDAVLQEHHSLGLDFCVGLLPGRTKEAARHRAKRIGLGFRKFKGPRPETDLTTIKAFNKFLGIRV